MTISHVMDVVIPASLFGFIFQIFSHALDVFCCPLDGSRLFALIKGMTLFSCMQFDQDQLVDSDSPRPILEKWKSRLQKQVRCLAKLKSRY